MHAIRRLVHDWPLACFLPLAFALSWYPWLIALAQGRSSGPNPLGPFAAALLVLAIGNGWSAVKALFAAMLRARVGAHWFALALGLPVVVVALVVVVNVAFGAPWPRADQLARWPGMLDTFLVALLFVALGEEPGWRGFLLPRLQQRFAPLMADLVLGAIWALWHLPLLGHAVPSQHVAPFLIAVFAATPVLSRLCNGARGSVLLPMLMHATVNATGAGFAFGFYQGNDLTRTWWIYAALWTVAAVLVLIATRPRRGR